VIKKYIFYLFRWQLSTPILAVVIWMMHDYGNLAATITANLIGGLLFFWVDRFIFKNSYLLPLWEIKENIICSGCGQKAKGFRLVKTKNYDRLNDPHPEFRCETCSSIKLTELKQRGVLTE